MYGSRGGGAGHATFAPAPTEVLPSFYSTSRYVWEGWPISKHGVLPYAASWIFLRQERLRLLETPALARRGTSTKYRYVSFGHYLSVDVFV